MYPTNRHYIYLIAKLTVCFFCVTLLFAGCYWCLGFSGKSIFKDISNSGFWDAGYFSLVTITTLGYGDLQPLGLARLLAGLEAVTGLVFAGYAISQVVSLKQEKLIEHLVKERFTFQYNACLTSLVEGKELISDRRREGRELISERRREDIESSVTPISQRVQSSPSLATRQFMFNQGNPFYPALRSMKTLNECAKYAHDHKQTIELLSTVKAAFHQIEELISVVRKYLITLNELKVKWNTSRTLRILKDLLKEITIFIERYLMYTTLFSGTYKNGARPYLEIFQVRLDEVRSIISTRPISQH
ncbi:two pore domain potassium channel family protein [Pseudomonas viridiflava]|uniref:potassium channel family protein n=1 Tax=Pseudomonas viridiflava TaxID=33069 RepID=UPI0018E5BD3D|nr:potassium channel family protein [Pseudomonas viridiflava]MBI6578736.1 two pore domain potassium channel family protein [Pseudomonas viridiflava]MBI6609498.1 two pore domain potassium channel family protein [Pseudomonas viridiflava]MBI6640301.1 two pore domain potassium channel family protein [Pseudomonas viridiflava]MBI6871081.1 two pore domain potassium channel family protein [Pseudomonas viridiflava]